MKKIALVLSGISFGGLERVMNELANYFSTKNEIEVHLISMTKGEHFFEFSDKIVFYEPDFYHRNYSRPVFTVKTYMFLRKKLNEIKPYSMLSFGGKYNSFVLFAALSLKIKTFISDRSRPSISYGKFLDILNSIMYKKADGFIAQTNRAKEIYSKRVSHKNIEVIGNPIRNISNDEKIEKENIILNVGRFIKSKHQDMLLEYFSKMPNQNWRLIFLGDGKYFEDVKRKSTELGLNDKVKFPGVVKNVDEYYLRSKIFAFTSSSEGFPNVLGEAMSAECACISFDCEAGPSDLINDGINGFLIPVGDHEQYKEKLKLLMEDEELRKRFGKAARKKIEENFSIEKIGKKYLEFITS